MDDFEPSALPKVATPREIDPVEFTSRLTEQSFGSILEALDFAHSEYGYKPRDLETVLMYNKRHELEHRSFLVLFSLRGFHRVALYLDKEDFRYHLFSYRKNSEIPVGSFGYGGD